MADLSWNGHEVSPFTLMRTAEFFTDRSETFVYKSEKLNRDSDLLGPLPPRLKR